MKRPRTVVLATAAVAVALAPTTASAQIAASESAVTTQTIDGTRITIEYSRPSLRGRDLWTDLFGNQIPWGKTWTPGANQATTIESNNDFRLGGVPVPAGRYSVWMLVDEDAWEFVLDPRDKLYHVAHPGPSDDQIRFPIEPTTVASSVESLSWSFPAVRNDGADLRMQWGDLAVDIAVQVVSSMRLTFTETEAAPYLGVYRVEQLPNDFSEGHEFELHLELEEGRIMGDMEFGPDFSMRLAFVEAADQVFRTAYLMEGEIAEVDAHSFFEFVIGEDGRASSFENRGMDDDLYMRATRVR